MVSFVWENFTKLANHRCDICKKVLTYLTGNKGLIYHMGIHGIIDPKTSSNKRPTDDDTSQPQSKKLAQKTLHDFCSKPTMEEDISRMLAVSNLTFNQIAHDKFIRAQLSKEYPGRTIPKDHTRVSALMMKFFESAEEEKKERIKKLKVRSFQRHLTSGPAVPTTDTSISAFILSRKEENQLSSA